MLQRRSRLDSCSSCHHGTVRARLHRLDSQLGTLGDILNMSLLVVLTRVHSQWVSAARFVASFAKRDISLPSRPASTHSHSLLKRGLLLLVVVTLLPVWAAVLLVKALTSSLLTIR